MVLVVIVLGERVLRAFVAMFSMHPSKGQSSYSHHTSLRGLAAAKLDLLSEGTSCRGARPPP